MKTHSAGYVLLYPLLFLTLFGLLLAGFLPRYTEWYRQAQLSCEAERLAGELRLLRYDPAGDQLTVLVTFPRSQVEDCYNLMPHPSPLMLTRQTGGRFQVLWPERADFPIAPQETFCFREGDRLVFSRWYEDPDYREEAVVRRFPDGAILEQTRGALFTAQDGQEWLLTE